MGICADRCRWARELTYIRPHRVLRSEPVGFRVEAARLGCPAAPALRMGRLRADGLPLQPGFSRRTNRLVLETMRLREQPLRFAAARMRRTAKIRYRTLFAFLRRLLPRCRSALEPTCVRNRMRIACHSCQTEGATGTPTESLLDEYAEACSETSMPRRLRP